MSLTPEQLAKRKLGIGSSEIAAVVGMNPYRGPHDVWAEKLGLSEPFEGNKNTRYGEVMEPVVLNEYEAMTGVKLDRTNKTVAHPDLPWAMATVDARAPDRIVEAKATSVMNADRWGEEGGDEVPTEYLCQVAWQMCVLDIDRADIVVAIPPDFRIYHIHRNMDFERHLIGKARQFWFDHVVAEVAPPIDSSDACLRNLAWRNRGGSYLEDHPECDGIMAKAVAAKNQMEHWEAEEKRLRAELLAAVGDDHKGYKNPLGTFYLTTRKGNITTNWESIARAKGVTQQEIDEATTFGKASKYTTLKVSKGEKK